MSYTNGEKPERKCPDEGFCHHGCPADPDKEPCFRTLWCAPFTAYDADGHWKDGDK